MPSLKWPIAVLCVSLLLICGEALPNRAPYITAKDRPLDVAHRGLSSILPENTMEAFEAALYQGADFIELDVVYTKEKLPLVMHDPFLTRITDIRSKSEFANRFETRSYYNNKTDWWTDTFNLAELQKLGIKQAQAPGRISIFDFKFTFPLLDDVVEMCIKFNKQHKGKRNPDGRLGGILIEAKDSQMYRDMYDLEIGETILQTLRRYHVDTIDEADKLCPIYLHSFDYGTVKYWAANTELPVNYLLGKGAAYDLEDVNKYATGIGFQDSMLWDYANKKPTNVISEMRSLGMKVHLWTFKDDVLLFEADNNVDMYKVGHRQLKLDAIITEFCDIYAPIAQLLREEDQER